MKNLILIAFLLLGTAAYSQNASSKAKAFLTKKHPQATDVQWNEYEDGWVADFELKGNYLFARFNQQGDWIETSQSLLEEELPEKIVEVCRQKYPEALIEGGEKIENPKGKFYKVTMSDEESYILTFSEDGKLLDTKHVVLDNDFDEDE